MKKVTSRNPKSKTGRLDRTYTWIGGNHYLYKWNGIDTIEVEWGSPWAPHMTTCQGGYDEQETRR